MQFDREKLKAAVLYTCGQCRPDELGAVKLHKVLYYADMLHYLESGSSLTGAIYRKRPFGPTCDSLLAIVKELSADHSLEVREVDYFGYRKKEFRALTEPDIGRLGQLGGKILDEVIEFVCRNNTAKTISEFSHSAPWEMVEFGEELAYHSALHLIPNQVSKEAFEWAEEQAQTIEAERSQKNPLDFKVFRALRSRVLEAREL